MRLFSPAALIRRHMLSKSPASVRMKQAFQYYGCTICSWGNSWHHSSNSTYAECLPTKGQGIQATPSRAILVLPVWPPRQDGGVALYLLQTLQLLDASAPPLYLGLQCGAPLRGE